MKHILFAVLAGLFLPLSAEMLGNRPFQSENDLKGIYNLDRKTMRIRKLEEGGSALEIQVPESFREAKNFDVFRSTYLYRQEGFDGLIHFYHTDGSYSNGWRYQDGKVVSRLTRKKPERTDGGIRKVKASHYWGAGRTDCW